MSSKRWIDEGWASLVPRLPEDLRAHAATLPARLGLAPEGTPWSEVFGHAVTLGAPALVLDALAPLPEDAVRGAVLAHLLGVIEAFGSDRIADGQIPPDGALSRLLAELRTRRDETLDGLASGGAETGRAADREASIGIAEEHAWLARGEPASLADYARVSLRKQAPGFPATDALARRAGASTEARRALTHALAGVWMGLQAHDDVVDWEEDHARGGAWVVALARGAGAPARGELDEVRSAVLASGVVAELLRYARRMFRTTRRLTRALGATALADWAAEREQRMAALFVRELRAPGATVRAHALAPWWNEVAR